MTAAPSPPAAVVVVSGDPEDVRRLQMALTLLARHLQTCGLRLPAHLLDATVVHAPDATTRPDATTVATRNLTGHGADMRLVLSKQDVADELGVSVRAVERLIRGGHLRAVRISRHTRIRSQDLRAYLDQLPTSTTEGDNAA